MYLVVIVLRTKQKPGDLHDPHPGKGTSRDLSICVPCVK